MSISDSRAVRGFLAASIVLVGAAVLPSATKKTVMLNRIIAQQAMRMSQRPPWIGGHPAPCADPWTIAAQPAEGSFDWIAISTTFLDDTYGGHAFEPFRAIAPSARAAYSIMLYDAHRPDVRAAFAITSARLANTSGVQPPAP